MSNEIETHVSWFIREFENICRVKGFDPMPGSPASQEIKSFQRRESIETAFSQGRQIFEAARDHWAALDYLVNSGKFACAPWDTARSVLESTAQSMWLLDLDIDAVRRVERSLFLRDRVIQSQIIYARKRKDTSMELRSQERRKEVASIAEELGYNVKYKEDGTVKSFVLEDSSYSKIVEKQFGETELYSELSGITHSDYVILTILGFVEDSGVHCMAVKKEEQQALLKQLSTFYCKAVWQFVCQYGYSNDARISVLLEEFYGKMGISDNSEDRFWRTLINVAN